MRYKYLVIALLLATIMGAQVKSNLKKAAKHIEKGNLTAAKAQYQAALEKEPTNERANLGMGILLYEYMHNYAEARPYLEEAQVAAAERDSSYDLLFAIANCYHYEGQYDKAISYYNRLNGIEDIENEIDLPKTVSKLKSDCEYAKSMKQQPVDSNIYVVNAGNTINTDMPEYVPVMINQNQIIFTSKRKDHKKEKVNYLDGKFFESMYIGYLRGHRFENVRLYALEYKKKKSKTFSVHESVVSMSQDGKKLFTFNDNKIYEIDLVKDNLKIAEEIGLKKFKETMTHAFLAKDNKTLYFTSDVPGGLGGTDIYKATRGDNGEWSKPENLGAPINTPYNEDAPFIGSDGNFYFASEGHPGYGNFDIYKSSFSDGKWNTPENLGSPINSPAHDLFMVFDSLGTTGYFSSSRVGGYGDMDLYRVVYLDKAKKDCGVSPDAVYLKVIHEDDANYKNKVRLNIPTNYKVLSAEWKIDGVTVENAKTTTLDNNYIKPGIYKISSKIVATCDTCMNPVVVCSYIDNSFNAAAPVLAANDKTTTTAPADPKNNNAQADAANTSTSPAVAVTPVEKTNDKPVEKTEDKEDVKPLEPVVAKTETTTTKPTSKPVTTKPTKTKPVKTTPEKKTNPVKTEESEAVTTKGVLSAEQLAAIGFNTSHILFDFNKTTLREDAYPILDNNIAIIKKHPELFLQVNGYADSRGSAAVNKRVSAARARSVKNYLVSHGVKLSQIKFTFGNGAENLLNDCGADKECDEALHQQNRRVEFVVTAGG